MKEVKQNKKICKFLKSGICRFGRSGKKSDEKGNVCSYSPPQICKIHEHYGKCKNHRCNKLHLKLCIDFMNFQQCSYENCKYLHPKMFRNNAQNQNHIMQGLDYKEFIPTYAKIARKSLTPNTCSQIIVLV